MDLDDFLKNDGFFDFAISGKEFCDYCEKVVEMTTVSRKGRRNHDFLEEKVVEMTTF